MLRNSLFLALLLCSTRIMLGQGPASGAGASPVPTIIKFSSTIRDVDGRELAGSRGLTFALYQNQEGGTSTWTESQTVALDSRGRYTVFLGSTSLGGIPPELFASGETQWIGVTPDDGIERPRFLITTVPYAFKAAEADTLGGRKPEEFVSVQQLTTLLGDGIGGLLVTTPAALGPGTAITGALDPGVPNGGRIGSLPLFRMWGLPLGVAAGSGLVSNGVNQPPVYQTKAVLDARDFGVTCSGTIDDTTAMQNAINAICNNGERGKTLVLPNSCAVKLTNTLNITKCSGITIDGEQSQGQATVGAAGGAGSGNAIFLWYGSAGGTVLEINQTRDSAFRHFTVFTNASNYVAPGANIGILIDEISPVTNIVTNNDFEDLQVYNGNAQNSSFIGIDICPTAPGNCEAQNFKRVTMGCGLGPPTSISNGIGIQYGPAGEAYYEYLHWYESTNCSKAISIPGGANSVNILDMDGGLAAGNYTDLWLNAGRNVSYRHFRSENGIAQIVIGNPSYSSAHDLTVEENSFAALTNNTTTISYPFYDTGGMIRIIKNDWDSNSTVTPFGPTGSGAFVGYFDSQDNNYPSITHPPVVSFAAKHSTLLDHSTAPPARK
jgi:hypothetical protein